MTYNSDTICKSFKREKEKHLIDDKTGTVSKCKIQSTELAADRPFEIQRQLRGGCPCMWMPLLLLSEDWTGIAKGYQEMKGKKL